MIRPSVAVVVSGVALLGFAALALPTQARQGAQQWGTVKGQVVWDDKVPAPEEIKAPPGGFPACQKGPLLSDKLVIDKETKGVRWVMVWLRDEKMPNAPLPIHPNLAKAAPNEVIDQPCCVFEPRMLGLRDGQNLLVKNSAAFAHNANIISIDGKNPNVNLALGAGQQETVKGWKASPKTTVVQCNIHPWMEAHIRVFDHPYFAVTDEKGNFEIKDAPAGTYRLVVWHPNQGWFAGDKTPDKNGKVITIKAGGVTQLDPVKAKLAE